MSKVLACISIRREKGVSRWCKGKKRLEENNQIDAGRF